VLPIFLYLLYEYLGVSELSNMCTDSIFEIQNCNSPFVCTTDYIYRMPREIYAIQHGIIYRITLSIFHWITWHIFLKIASIHIYDSESYEYHKVFSKLCKIKSVDCWWKQIVFDTIIFPAIELRQEICSEKHFIEKSRLNISLYIGMSFTVVRIVLR